MPSMANITINNGASTPVAVTFTPADVDQNHVARYQDQSGGIPAGYGRIGISLKRPAPVQPGQSSKDSTFRAVLKIDVPTLEVTSPSTMTGLQPAPTVAYTTIATLEFVLPSRMTEDERKNILAYAKNLLSHQVATDTVVNLLNQY